jgi:hypothetical protein
VTSWFLYSFKPLLSNATCIATQRRRGGGIPGFKGHNQRRGPSIVAQRIDIVAANAGDSGALLVPFAHDEEVEMLIQLNLV